MAQMRRKPSRLRRAFFVAALVLGVCNENEEDRSQGTY